MRFKPSKCPECGEPPEGMREKLYGLALLTGSDELGFDYAGETEVDWDSQETVVEGGLVTLQCANAHAWHAEKEDD